MAGFCISFTGEQISKPGFKDAIQELTNAEFVHMNDQQAAVAKELGVSDACADAVVYLRTRSRHTQLLEDELITLHKAGTPPNIMEFGCTEQTGKALMSKIEKEFALKGISL